MNEENRITSRKLLVSVVAASIIAFAKQLGVDLDESQIYGLVGIVSAYCVGNGLEKFNKK